MCLFVFQTKQSSIRAGGKLNNLLSELDDQGSVITRQSGSCSKESFVKSQVGTVKSVMVNYRFRRCRWKGVVLECKARRLGIDF